MKVRFVVTEPEEGGLTSAARRLARALIEQGHLCEMLVPAGSQVAAGALVPQLISQALPAAGGEITDAAALRLAIADGAPDAVIVGEGRADLLELSASAAPTLLHSHLHWAVCPDTNRYWNRVGRECPVRAGWTCLAIRPLMGCSGRGRMLSLDPILEQRRIVDLLRTGRIGTLAISARQAELLYDHDVPTDRIAVLPNLGMRMTESALADAATAVPDRDRSRIAFIGRLSKEKGARLLPAIDEHLGHDDLRVYGDGYLAGELGRALPAAMRGQVTQEGVAGVLQWARALLFPALWPEPGGIVGIDSQLFGVPTAAFGIGAALDWPAATLFERNDADGMGRWGTAQTSLTEPRDPGRIAARQVAYWELVGRRADGLIRQFTSTGRFDEPGRDAVTADLAAATDLDDRQEIE